MLLGSVVSAVAYQALRTAIGVDVFLVELYAVTCNNIGILDMLLACVLGACCGALAVLYIKLHVKCMNFQKMIRRKPVKAFACVAWFLLVEIFSRTTTCQGRPLWSSNLKTKLEDLLSASHLSVSPWAAVGSIPITLTIFLLAESIIVLVTCTLPVSAGLFTPLFLLGAALGRLWGELRFTFGQHPYNGRTGVICPAGWAAIGAAAFAGGATSTLSTVVVTLELTNNSTLAVPIALAVLSVSFWGAAHPVLRCGIHIF
ncbi:MAG: uncharacterized protein KVP18_001459 [Porospora cf. gigantea A]|uniref:uncharacterized protein n=1 Tax=Porospora cf. gigantea A TaxID=2853593 RepID=UPI00355A9E4C|nr:MAG: hypothetical protein KVP18_001459 [Porospora cf. gigantea A]